MEEIEDRIKALCSFWPTLYICKHLCKIYQQLRSRRDWFTRRIREIGRSVSIRMIHKVWLSIGFIKRVTFRYVVPYLFHIQFLLTFAPICFDMSIFVPKSPLCTEFPLQIAKNIDTKIRQSPFPMRIVAHIFVQKRPTQCHVCSL